MKLDLLKTIFLILSTLPLIFQSPALASETITLTGGEKFITSSYGKWLEKVYKEAFRRLGYQLVIVGYPSQRAIVMADNGEVDGQLERGYHFIDDHPNLIRVKEYTNREAYSVYAVQLSKKVSNWNDLKRVQGNIAARRGVGKSVEKLEKLVGVDRMQFVETPMQALEMLKAGRVELYIEYEPVVNETLELTEFSKIRKIGTLDYTTHHAFLHIKHKNLAPKLSKVLSQMKKEGLFIKYKKEINSLSK